MKTIIKLSIITAFFLLQGKVKAQIQPQEQVIPIESRFENNTPLNSDLPIYYKDENNIFHKFLGEWKYQNTNIELTVSILKNKHISMGMGNYESDNFEDELMVRLELKVDGVVKYNTSNNHEAPIFGNFINTMNRVELSYNEPSLSACHRSRTANLVLEFLGDNPQQLSWQRINTSSGIQKLPCEDGSEPDDSPFLIPENLTLTKAE